MSACSSSYRLVLGQQKGKNKSNEITAIPELLEMLSLEGAVLTLDASGMSERYRLVDSSEKKPIISSCLKANHKGMYERVFDGFQVAIEENFVEREYEDYQAIESGYHRS